MNELRALGGAVVAQFTFTDPMGMHAALETCRLEQEAMCGYSLVVGPTRQTSYDITDADTGKATHIWECFVTFMPAPPPRPTDATLLPPAI